MDTGTNWEGRVIKKFLKILIFISTSFRIFEKLNFEKIGSFFGIITNFKRLISMLLILKILLMDSTLLKRKQCRLFFILCLLSVVLQMHQAGFQIVSTKGREFERTLFYFRWLKYILKAIGICHTISISTLLC